MSAADARDLRQAAAAAGFLTELDEDEVATVLGHAESRRYAKGELAVRRGEVDRSLFLVSAGTFEVLVPGAGGLRQVGLLRAGEIFGDLAFFDGEPRSADVRAIESAEALVMTPAGFERLRLTEPRLAVCLVVDLGRMLSARFRDVSRRLASQP